MLLQLQYSSLETERKEGLHEWLFSIRKWFCSSAWNYFSQIRTLI